MPVEEVMVIVSAYEGEGWGLKTDTLSIHKFKKRYFE